MPVVSPEVRKALTVKVSLLASEPEVIEYPSNEGSPAPATLDTELAVIVIERFPNVIVAGSDAEE